MALDIARSIGGDIRVFNPGFGQTHRLVGDDSRTDRHVTTAITETVATGRFGKDVSVTRHNGAVVCGHMNGFGTTGPGHIVDGCAINVGQNFTFELVTQQNTGTRGYIRRVKAQARNQVAKVNIDLPPIVIGCIIHITEVNGDRTALAPAGVVGEVFLS